MDIPELPEGHGWRRPAIADAEAILALATDYNVPLVGSADYTLEDVRDDLADPNFDPAEDGWLVSDAAGSLVGYGWTARNGESDEVQVEVLTKHDQVAEWLHRQTADRGRQMAREHGHPRAVLHQGIYRQDDALRARLERWGFVPVTVFNRMRIDHTGPVPAPEPPTGLVLRRDPDDEGLRRTAHEVMTEAFREHFGFAEWTAEKWIDSWASRSTFDWSQLCVAELDSEPVGILITTRQFIEDENCGYVAELGVLRQARGKGVAKYLLRWAFARDAAAGLTGTILHVDANNTTPALGLYESVGMRSVLTVDVYEKAVDIQASTPVATSLSAGS